MTQLPTVLAPATPALPPKPGYVRAIAIMCLADGIVSILIGLILTLVYICGLVTICCAPIAIYSIVLGILEVVYATRVLPDPILATRPATYLAVMQIVNIINCDPISVTIGILSLVFYNDPKVKDYFRALYCQRPA
jgi:hypothetical protein